MNANVKLRRLKPSRHRNHRFARLQIDVKDFAASLAVKVAMFAHVRTEARRATAHFDLLDQPTFHQSIQAIIDRRHGNIRHITLGAQKDLLSRWMITVREQYIVNLLSLRRETQSTRREPFIQPLNLMFG